MTIDDQTTSLVLLSSLDQVGPARLKWLLGIADSPIEVLEKLRKRKIPNKSGPAGLKMELVEKWCNQAKRLSESKVVETLGELNVEVLTPQRARWPILADDPDAPALLFARGNLGHLDAPKIAIVGTRRCSSVGRKVARDLGHELTDQGISVVSGLALGIDREAHIGAAAASSPKPVAVLGTGIDVCYPTRNQSLFDRLLECGLIISELPPGIQPRRWQFPARNRIIAGLADATVVVESHIAGGSLLTADEAIERDKPVLAVPGSVLSAACVGTNQLLRDGATICTGVESVVESVYGFGLSERTNSIEETDASSSLAELILAEARTGSGTISSVLTSCSEAPDSVFVEVQRLVADGKLALSGERLGLVDATMS